MDLRGAVLEPGRVDEEDDRGDQDLAEPSENEEERRKNDPPETQFRKSDRVRKVQHVPSEPENQWPEQNHGRDHERCDRQTAGNKSSDSEDS
jgi:hypothetical protein